MPSLRDSAPTVNSACKCPDEIDDADQLCPACLRDFLAWHDEVDRALADARLAGEWAFPDIYPDECEEIPLSAYWEPDPEDAAWLAAQQGDPTTEDLEELERVVREEMRRPAQDSASHADYPLW